MITVSRLHVSNGFGYYIGYLHTCTHARTCICICCSEIDHLHGWKAHISNAQFIALFTYVCERDYCIEFVHNHIYIGISMAWTSGMVSSVVEKLNKTILKSLRYVHARSRICCFFLNGFDCWASFSCVLNLSLEFRAVTATAAEHVSCTVHCY